MLVEFLIDCVAQFCHGSVQGDVLAAERLLAYGTRLPLAAVPNGEKSNSSIGEIGSIVQIGQFRWSI
jgi:hypothetical protein